ncbi:MAG: lysophospholipid acyltransferase family protein [Candidatus Omnitrophica bacterium]|nr:lysophospholipid acyltransferase family protein [Candidatus Omnitrophota bacterium]
MLYLAYKIGLAVLRITTRRVAYGMVSFISAIKYTFSVKDKALVRSNLKAALPNTKKDEIESLTRDVFKNFGNYLVDFFTFSKENKEYLKNIIKFEGLDNLNQALKLGKGCIIITGHFGNWEIAGCALAVLGYKINVVALDHMDRRINNLFINLRKKAGVNVIPIGAARNACMEALRRNEIIAILGDRPYGDRGIQVNFFGKTAMLPRGAALFSLKAACPIVTAFSYKDDAAKNSYKAVLDKPFLTERGADTAAQLKEITQRYVNRFESYIRKYPSQWYVFNRVWE